VILIALVLFLIMLVLLPLLFADLMAVALVKLHLDPSTAVFLVLAMILGGLINIPVKRITRTEMVSCILWQFSACGTFSRGGVSFGAKA
jgi:uncharacterized membrane protein